MKKFLVLALAIVMALSFVACDSAQSGNQTANVSRGSVNGDVYTSEYLGLSFTKPSSWVYSTDEEIAAAMNLGAEKLLGENFKDALENNPSVYDMMVADTVTRTNINVGFENLTKTFSSNITVDQYIQALEAQLANVSGMTVTFPSSVETVKLGKTEFTKVVCSVNAMGVSMKQVYYLNKEDKFMRFVIVTIPSGYTVEQIEAMFR